MADVPRMSVVMPARNAERYLHEAIESILHQTFTAFELIAVDDHSDDRTREILDEAQRADPRVRVLPVEGTGLVDALTTGVAAARSDLIARFDADDRSAPERLQRQWDFLQEHRDVGLLGSSASVIDAAGRPIGVIRYPLQDPIIRLTLRHQTAFAHGAVVMRRGALITAGGYRMSAHPAEDYELWCRLVAGGVRAANLDAPLYEYRVHGESVTGTRPAAVRRKAREVGRAYAHDLRRPPGLVDTWRAVGQTVVQVMEGEAAPTALRRASTSLLEAARAWLRSAPGTALTCVIGALRAESRYRRLRD